MNTKYEIVTTRMGVLSIRDNLTREIMHNPVGPWAEANALYIEQSRFKDKLSENLETEIVVFDVGLGAAANALAALHCARDLKNRRPLRLISFERDLDLLKFALENAQHFEHFSGYETAVQSIVEHGRWTEPGIMWELRDGDFIERIDAEPQSANLVFYDPYSFKTNVEMWVPEVFRKVREKCQSDGILFTYSRATPIRVGLLLAGFFLGEGTATGAKEETTQASVRFEDLANPLGSAWFEKWRRSHKANAVGGTDEDFAGVREFIQSHPQFLAR